MSHRYVANVDSTVLTLFPELVIVEVGAKVGDDSVWEAIAMHDVIQEVEDPVSIGCGDWFDLNPLGELVDSHQYSVENPWRIW